MSEITDLSALWQVARVLWQGLADGSGKLVCSDRGEYSVVARVTARQRVAKTQRPALLSYRLALVN